MSPINAPESDLDPFSADFIADPYDEYARLRKLGPVAVLPAYGVAAVSHASTVRRVLRDHETFSSVGGPGLVHGGRPVDTGVIISSDPPMHTRVRRVVSKFFTPRSLSDVEADVRSRATAMLDAIVGAGTVDVVPALCEPVPVGVFCDLVGLPDESRDRLPRWADAMFDLMGPCAERQATNFALAGEFGGYVMKMLSEQPFVPGSIAATIFGEALADGQLDVEEAASLFGGLLVAGMDTTSNFLANALHLFGTHPEQWSVLRNDPALLDRACEEVLRYEAPVQLFFRQAVVDVEVEGVTIPEGTRVMVAYGSANRDEHQYADPHVFDIARAPADHLSFGSGIHLCLGAPLARIEGRAVLGELAARVAQIDIEDAHRKQVNIVRGFHSLRLRLS